MTVGNPFGSNAPAANIIVGNEQGEVVILNEEKILATLDTKGGPIQSILLHDVTGFGDTDLITGDSNGTVTIFSRQQILSKTQVGAPVRCLDVFHDAVGDFEIMAGDSLGALTSFMPHSQLWKLNVADTAPPSKRAGPTPIRALLPILISDKHGIETAYLLVCNGAPFVHFVQDGARTMSLRCPSIVNSMCSGYFRKRRGSGDVNDVEIADGREQVVQIVLGCSDGYVYLLEDFKITRLLNVEYPITNVVTFKRKSSSAPAGPSSPEIDILACTGHFNDVRFYQDGTVCTFPFLFGRCAILIIGFKHSAAPAYHSNERLGSWTSLWGRRWQRGRGDSLGNAG